MTWSLQDRGSGGWDVRAIPFALGFEVAAAATEGESLVLAGCAVTVGSGMTLAVAKGSVLAGGNLLAIAAGNVVISAAHADYWRIDLVVVTSGGALAVRAGTAAVQPRPPARTAGDVVLAFVFVQQGVTSLINGDIVDMRPLRTLGPICLGKVTTAVTINNTNAATVVYSLTVPDGLLATGRQLVLRLGGNYLSNSGTPTWTWQVRIGGAGVWQDVTAATAADADRGAWDMDLVITASGASAQKINGHIRFQTPADKTAPAVGVGDLSVTTSIAAPIRGTGAANMDGAGNVVIDVRVTMSVANAAVETVMDHAYAWLQ